MKRLIGLVIGCVVGQALLAGERVDPRVRTFVDPVRIVSASKPSECLLERKSGQTPEGKFLAGSGVLMSTNDFVLVDFGRELHGGISIGCGLRTAAKTPIRVVFGESVGEALSTLGVKGAMITHSSRDAFLTATALGQVEFGNTGFRFVKVELPRGGQLQLESLRAVSLMRPMEVQGEFRCSDERLNRIWQTAVRTVHLCSQDFLWDGIKRDRLVWQGDMHPEMMAILYAFGADPVLTQSLDYLIEHTSPEDGMNNSPSYSMWFVRCLRDYWFWSGDNAYVRRHAEYLKATLKYLAGYVHPDGTWKYTGIWDKDNGFLDWPTYNNVPATRAGMQGLYVYAFDSGLELMRFLNDVEGVALCEKTLAALRKIHPDPHGSKSAAAILALSGVRTPRDMFAEVLGRNGAKGFTTFYGYYMLEAISAAGRTDIGLSTVRDYWGGMLDMGATSFWEGFDLGWTNNVTRLDELPVAGKKDIHGDFGEHCYQGYRHSLCHGWSAGPAAWLIRRVLGLSPLTPGCAQVEVKPELGSLDWAEGAMPTPRGPVRVRAERVNGKVQVKVFAPEGLKVVGDTQVEYGEPRAKSFGAYLNELPPLNAVHLGGKAEVKADVFFRERVFGPDAKGKIYEEAANAFRTCYDDLHPEIDWMKKGVGLWQGEYWGKTMLSSAQVAEYSGNAEHLKWLRDKALAFVAEFQQPDGYLCSYSDRHLLGGPKPGSTQPRGWNSEVFAWNLWSRKYTMWALIELARVTKEPKLLVAASKIMDQEIDQLRTTGVRIENTGFFAGIPSMSVLKPLLLLYRATGNERYRAFAREIVSTLDRQEGNPIPNLVANAFGDKPMHEWYPAPQWWAKTYESLSCMEGLVDWAVHENDARVLEAVRRNVAKLEKSELNALESVGYFDHFTHAAACVNSTTEPCDVTHWIRVCRELFLALDDPHYLDLIEKAYYNGFLAGVYRDGKWGSHSVRCHGSRHRPAPHQVGMEYHQCCIDNMPRTYMDVAQTVVTSQRDGSLSINLYSDANVKIGDTPIAISGNYPFADAVTVRIASPTARKVRFRIPAGFDAVRIDGVSAKGPWYAAEVPRGGKTFRMDFVRTPRLVPFAATAGDVRAAAFERPEENPEMKGLSRTTAGVRILYGPLVLAKGLYAGTAKDEILRDRVGDGQGWTASIRALAPTKTDGLWELTLKKGAETYLLKVADLASVADIDDPHNLFSIWF